MHVCVYVCVRIKWNGKTIARRLKNIILQAVKTKSA